MDFPAVHCAGLIRGGFPSSHALARGAPQVPIWQLLVLTFRLLECQVLNTAEASVQHHHLLENTTSCKAHSPNADASGSRAQTQPSSSSPLDPLASMYLLLLPCLQLLAPQARLPPAIPLQSLHSDPHRTHSGKGKGIYIRRQDRLRCTDQVKGKAGKTHNQPFLSAYPTTFPTFSPSKTIFGPTWLNFC